MLKAANLALRFVLELAALAALAYWGFTVGGPLVARVLLGVSAPLAAALAWGLYVAPRAKMAAPPAQRLAVELTVFVLAIAALAAAGHPLLTTVFALLVLVNSVLTTVWRQRWYS